MTDESSDTWVRRRTVLRAAGTGLAAATLGAGVSSPAAAQSDGPDYGGWLDDVGNYDGTTVDNTGTDQVTVQVGAQGNGGPYAFSPPAMRVDPGTTVTFEWVSDTHNLMIEEQPSGADWQGHETIENSGFSYDHTFETEGIYKYFCQPHRALGMKGAIVVGGSGGGGGGGGAVGEPDYGDWFTDVGNFDGTTADERGSDQVTVQVGAQGNGGPYAFSPPAVRIDPGTTVTFEWVSDTHNTMVEEQPSGADWQGHEPIENSGFSYDHTFETEGVYKYFCQPHRALGMKGAIVVGNVGGGGGEAGGGGEGGQLKLTPALTMVGAGLVVAVLSPFVFGIALWRRYRRQAPEVSYRGPETSAALEAAEEEAEREPFAEEAPVEEPEIEIDHDEYDPFGTASAIVVYFVIIVLMWVFMYFVEFLGNGPTVIG